jgi:hypothetical protein
MREKDEREMVIKMCERERERERESNIGDRWRERVVVAFPPQRHPISSPLNMH